MVLGGEAVILETVDIWADRLQVVNGYGPAEATICAAGCIPATGWRISTIGPMLGSVNAIRSKSVGTAGRRWRAPCRGPRCSSELLNSITEPAREAPD